MKARNVERSKAPGKVHAQAKLRPGFVVWLFAVLGCLPGFAADRGSPPIKAADLFQLTKVWSVHLQFTPEQWKAMEPEASGLGMPGMGGPRLGGPGGPAMLLAPNFLKGDEDKDGKLSEAEFLAVGERWFSNWDKAKSGSLDLDQLRAGISSTLVPDFHPGGPGGPEDGSPGPALQGANGRRNGLAAASGIDYKYVHADLEFEGQLLRDVAVRYKGNSTFMEARNSIKRSFKIDLNKYVKGQKLAGVTKLSLHNNVTDASWMNEVLSHRLFRDAGVPAPRTAYARVYVTVPGEYDNQYFGLYSIVEDLDRHFAEEQLGSKEGAMFKPVTHDFFGYRGTDWSKYEQAYDPKTELSESEKQRVIDFSQLVTSASDSEFSNKLAEYLDLEEFARFMSVTVWLSTLDSILMMGQNFYVYLHPQTHKFEFLPWDLDHSFGQFPMGGSQQEREQLSIQKPWKGTNRFLERVFKNETFKKLYLATLAEFSKTIFVPDRFGKQVDEVAGAIRPAVREESDLKLTRFDKVVAGESVGRLGFGGGPGRQRRSETEGDEPRRFGPGGFGQPAKPIKGFVVARAQSVKDQLSGKSEGATIAEGGFRGPGGRGFRGGPGGFGPGMFLARGVMEAFDSNKDGKLTHEEFRTGFAKWFEAWNTDKSGMLSQEQLRAGINRDLVPFRWGPAGGRDFGPPEGGPLDE
jgi:spore coat protein H